MTDDSVTSPTALYTNLAPSVFTTITSESSRPSIAVVTHKKPEPITIPVPTLRSQDSNRISTPLTGRAHKQYLFALSRSPSPRRSVSRFSGKQRSNGSLSDEEFFGHFEISRGTSPVLSVGGRRTTARLSMRNEAMPIGRYPASPLSPKPSPQSNLSPQSSSRRGNHGRHASRSGVGRFHPSNYKQADVLPSSSTGMHPPQMTLPRAPPAIIIESPRLMREKQREFLEKTKLSSKIAASSLSVKPDAPRLDPLGSPKGPVTPLELEEATDYFSVMGVGRVSPAVSPTARSSRSRSDSDEGDAQKPNKNRKLAI